MKSMATDFKIFVDSFVWMTSKTRFDIDDFQKTCLAAKRASWPEAHEKKTKKGQVREERQNRDQNLKLYLICVFIGLFYTGNVEVSFVFILRMQNL